MIATGTPTQLATDMHSALSRRRSGAHFAVVLRSRDTAELVETHTKKLDRIERERSDTIAGYYIGHRLCGAKVSVEEIHEAIVETIKGMK